MNDQLLDRMREGFPPSISDTIQRIKDTLDGRRFGGPLTKRRAAVHGLPIGGETGLDIKFTFDEIKEDLGTLYQGVVRTAAETIDTYEVFSVRNDRLTLKINQLRLEVETLLAQVGARSRASIFDSFNTLDNVDPERTTVAIDLDEGIATLAPDSTRSIKYDGSRARVISTLVPQNAVEPGPPFHTVFSQYRLDSWYLVMPVGTEFVAHVNATGVNYDAGGREEILVNGIRIEPNSPLHVELEWSPDGRNWHKFTPNAAATIRARHTFNFNVVPLGYIRLRLRHTEEVIEAFPGQPKQLGVKRIEFLQRGFKPLGSLFSNEYRFNETVHSVLVDMDAVTPYGTKITPYIAQSSDGPWTSLNVGEPVKFNVIAWVEQTLSTSTAENSGNLATMWEVLSIPESLQPLPESGELIAGRNQVQLSCYQLDWKTLGDRDRIPSALDWASPPSEVRTGLFSPLGDIGVSGDISTTIFIDEKNPLAIDSSTGESYSILCLVQGDGTQVLQKGYNYRLRTYVWCQAPITLEEQKIGVVNTGGTAGLKIAPLSLYVNGAKVFQQDACASTVSGLNSSEFRTTLAFNQGYNSIDLYLQLPTDIIPGADGVASTNIFLYLQPDLFASNLEQTLGIKYIQAYKDPWKRVSEFDLRYNTPIGVKGVWAWEIDILNNITTNALLNHDFKNSRSDLVNAHPSYRTIDGINSGQITNLLLRYPTEKSIDGIDTRTLYFRADLSQEPGADAPPVLSGYQLIVN